MTRRWALRTAAFVVVPALSGALASARITTAGGEETGEPLEVEIPVDAQ